jgi:transposase
MRKAFLKKGLTSTVSWEIGAGAKRRAAKAALKVKQGEKSDHSPNGKLPESRAIWMPQ